MPTNDDDAPWQGHTQGSREYRLILAALTCAGIATFAQLYSPQGVLPRIAENLGVRPDQAALLISAATIGLALGVLPWSWLADRMGRVRAMKTSLVVATLCGFAVTAWPGFEGILVLRALEGFALGGLPAAAIAYLNEEVHPSQAGMAAAIYVSGTTVGGLSGRVLSVPVADAFGWRVAILVVTALGALATLAFMLSIPKARGFKPDAQTRLPLIDAIRLNLRPDMLVLFAQGFLLMGGLVAIYNYMTFHLEAPPFSLRPTTISLLLFSYLAGTFSASWAGGRVRRHGRLKVLCSSIAIMLGGAALMLGTLTAAFVLGLVLFTAGFFAAHAIAAGWVGQRATGGRSQAASLYNLFYYAGSSFFGWFCGLVFVSLGWTATVCTVIGMAVLAAVLVTWHARSAAPP
ncbi:MFS transporter [Roseateles saccharophilus]|uniref:Putative MFS family arabinose efflux permease n=1 Tax=Roseateles saccharophilus TaxID=304 RepID=A0A4R3UJN1_ROSSA|nr:MFS transporter [Roseateles saccharophilus]MDG0834266.1 MFS transporter [Roseateles saccharophilus]TCU91876.1 putative MFS family arabinose efflux permease [Roseateles saccharophilus]